VEKIFSRCVQQYPEVKMALTTSVLDYTARDWSRWDTFDFRRYTYVTRLNHGLQDTPLTAQAATASLPATYFHMFRQEFMTTSYAYGKQMYLWTPPASVTLNNYINQLRTTGALSPLDIVKYCSYALQQEYDNYRKSETARLRYALKLRLNPLPPNANLLLDDQARDAFDQLAPNFRQLANFQPLITDLSKLLNNHLDNQCLDPNVTVAHSNPNDWRGPTWRTYGAWFNPITKTYEEDAKWTAADYAFLYARYLHLFDDTLIRRIRESARASAASLWRLLQLNGDGTNSALESQWILVVSAWVSYAYVLQRSEDELRARGVWGQVPADLVYEDSSDVAVATRAKNRDIGQWSQQELTDQAKALVEVLYKRYQTTGASEYLGSYTNFQLNYISIILVHCPKSQAIYDMLSTIWRRMQWDLIVNYHPSTASFPGPAMRSYDLATGTHSYHDRLDLSLYYKHVFAGAAKTGVLLRVLTSGEKVIANLKIAGPGYYQNPTYGEAVVSPHRIAYTAAQLAGEGYLPYQELWDLVVSAPVRLNEQRFSLVAGQERYNFITPGYTLGHGGENTYLTANSNSLVARIGGLKPPRAGVPLMTAYDGPTQTSAYIRLCCDTAGAPLLRPGGITDKYGAPGAETLRRVRSVTTQYQGFLLTTRMFAPTRDTPVEEITTAPWYSHLILPLSIDKLTVGVGSGAVDLPITEGTKLKISSQPLIFTAWHGNSAVVVRLVSYDRTSPEDITWQVDAPGISASAGRISVQHRAANTTDPVHPFKSTWLMGCGTVTSAADVSNLQQLLLEAPVTQNLVVTAGVWDESNQPARDYPVGSSAAPIGEVGARRWTTTANIGNLQLVVDRTDVYQPWGNAPAYAQPAKGPLYTPPYYSKDVHRTVNGREILTWQVGEDPYRTTKILESNIFAPHRTNGNAQVGWLTSNPSGQEEFEGRNFH
jgi:hypothetical protein